MITFGGEVRKEIIKRMPFPGAFLLISAVLFIFSKNDLAAWICLVVAIIFSLFMIRITHYEKIIDYQDKRIGTLIKDNLNTHKMANNLIKGDTQNVYNKKWTSETTETDI